MRTTLEGYVLRTAAHTIRLTTTTAQYTTFERITGGAWDDTNWPACIVIAERFRDWHLIPAALRQK